MVANALEGVGRRCLNDVAWLRIAAERERGKEQRCKFVFPSSNFCFRISVYKEVGSSNVLNKLMTRFHVQQLKTAAKYPFRHKILFAVLVPFQRDIAILISANICKAL